MTLPHMDTHSLLLLVILVVIALLAIWLGLKSGIPYPYTPKPVMTKSELILYHRLLQALPEYRVLAQVQLSSFLKVGGGKDRMAALNRVLQKSADFVICADDASVRVIVELQDATHERPDRAKSDEFKRKAFKAAGLPFVEFHVKKMPSIEEIRRAVR
jgi:hypothetical protein